jgi:hypothetical protein
LNHGERYVAANVVGATLLESRINGLVRENREIHEERCINLNPATQVMNPKAEALLASPAAERPQLAPVNSIRCVSCARPPYIYMSRLARAPPEGEAFNLLAASLFAEDIMIVPTTAAAVS